MGIILFNPATTNITIDLVKTEKTNNWNMKETTVKLSDLSFKINGGNIIQQLHFSLLNLADLSLSTIQ